MPHDPQDGTTPRTVSALPADSHDLGTTLPRPTEPAAPSPVAPPVLVAPAEAPASPTRLDALHRFFRGFVRDLAFFVGLFLFIYYFVMNVSVVRGKSMEPTFHDGDRLIVDKISYRMGDITEKNRFDVVVLKNPHDPSEDYIKRLVAFPGERVSMRDGVLRINGKEMDYEGVLLDHDDFDEITVEDGHYFVLGDNRQRSNDSRMFRGVPRDYIKGKIRLRVWPFDSFRIFGRYEPDPSHPARRED